MAIFLSMKLKFSAILLLAGLFAVAPLTSITAAPPAGTNTPVGGSTTNGTGSTPGSQPPVPSNGTNPVTPNTSEPKPGNGSTPILNPGSINPSNPTNPTGGSVHPNDGTTDKPSDKQPTEKPSASDKAQPTQPQPSPESPTSPTSGNAAGTNAGNAGNVNVNPTPSAPSSDHK